MNSKSIALSAYTPQNLNGFAKLFRMTLNMLRISEGSYRAAIADYVNSQPGYCPSEAFDRLCRQVAAKKMSYKSFQKNLEVCGIKLESIDLDTLEAFVSGHGATNIRVAI